MSSDVITDTVLCLPSRPSSRIGYRMIPPRNPSHAIPDMTTYSFRPVHLPAQPYRSYCFPPRFPPNRVARRVDSRHDAILPATHSACLLASSHLIDSSHRLIRFARRLLALPAARRRHLPSAPCGSSISSDPPHLIGSSLVPPRFPSYFPPSVLPVACPSRQSHQLIWSYPAPIVLPHRMRRATSRQIGAQDGQSTTARKTPRHPTPIRYRKCPSPPAV